jgi:hypothetical protein
MAKSLCPTCPERQKRIHQESQEAGLRWTVQKLRNRLKELSQQAGALSQTADEALAKPRSEG